MDWLDTEMGDNRGCRDNNVWGDNSELVEDTKFGDNNEWGKLVDLGNQWSNYQCTPYGTN